MECHNSPKHSLTTFLHACNLHSSSLQFILNIFYFVCRLIYSSYAISFRLAHEHVVLSVRLRALQCVLWSCGILLSTPRYHNSTQHSLSLQTTVVSMFCVASNYLLSTSIEWKAAVQKQVWFLKASQLTQVYTYYYVLELKLTCGGTRSSRSFRCS